MTSLDQHIEQIINQRIVQRYDEVTSQITELHLLLHTIQNEQQKPILLSYRDAAKLFQVSRQVLSRLHSQGKLQSEVKGGRGLLFKYEVVRDALNNREQKKLNFNNSYN